MSNKVNLNPSVAFQQCLSALEKLFDSTSAQERKELLALIDDVSLEVMTGDDFFTSALVDDDGNLASVADFHFTRSKGHSSLVYEVKKTKK